MLAVVSTWSVETLHVQGRLRVGKKTHPPSTILFAQGRFGWLAVANWIAGERKWEGAFLPRRRWLAVANGTSFRAPFQELLPHLTCAGRSF